MNEPKPIPETSEKESILSYTTPNVLLHSKDGTVHVLEASTVQIPHKTRAWFSKTREEKREVFKPNSHGRFNICGHVVNVLCDEAVYRGNPYTASVPTATEYLALIGKEVRIYYDSKLCHPDFSKQYGVEELWRSAEIVITLPDLKDE